MRDNPCLLRRTPTYTAVYRIGNVAGAAQCLRPIHIWPNFYAKQSWKRKVTDSSARHHDRSAHRQQRWDDCLEITCRGWPRCDGLESSDGQGHNHSPILECLVHGVRCKSIRSPRFLTDGSCKLPRPGFQRGCRCLREMQPGSRRIDAIPHQAKTARAITGNPNLIGLRRFKSFECHAPNCLALCGIFAGNKSGASRPGV